MPIQGPRGVIVGDCEVDAEGLTEIVMVCDCTAEVVWSAVPVAADVIHIAVGVFVVPIVRLSEGEALVDRLAPIVRLSEGEALVDRLVLCEPITVMVPVVQTLLVAVPWILTDGRDEWELMMELRPVREGREEAESEFDWELDPDAEDE